MFILGMKKIFECQIININNTYLNVNIEDILTILSHCKGYIIEYYKRNLLDELKHNISSTKFLKNHPYLDVDCIGDTICHEQLVFKDVENLFNVDCFAHDFHDFMQDANITYDQQ
jgi:hypothetical protein